MRCAVSILSVALLFPVFTAPFAAQAQEGQTTIQQFQKIEDSWSVALVNKDQFALENLLQPTFVDISAAGAVNTRNQRIADILDGLPQPLYSVEQKVVNVRVVSDIAVVEGTYIFRLKEDQRMRNERGIFTHVFQRSRNNWSCISAQRTAVVDEVEGSKGSKARAEGAPDKQSKAEAPFHIPLLYKGAKPADSTPAAPAATPAPASPQQ